MLNLDAFWTPQSRKLCKRAASKPHWFDNESKHDFSEWELTAWGQLVLTHIGLKPPPYPLSCNVHHAISWCLAEQSPKCVVLMHVTELVRICLYTAQH